MLFLGAEYSQTVPEAVQPKKSFSNVVDLIDVSFDDVLWDISQNSFSDIVR